eukprot:262489-Rhodomonas_salina.1
MAAANGQYPSANCRFGSAFLLSSSRATSWSWFPAATVNTVADIASHPPAWIFSPVVRARELGAAPASRRHLTLPWMPIATAIASAFAPFIPTICPEPPVTTELVPRNCTITLRCLVTLLGREAELQKLLYIGG